MLLAVGGGSVIDCTKYIGAAAYYDGDAWDILELKTDVKKCLPTHGLGLAILTPRWMEYCLDETTVSKYYQFGCNVFGLDASLEPMEVAKKSIELVKEFLYQTLGLKSTFTDIGIDDSNFEVMAEKAVMLGGLAHAFKPLNKEDVVNIFKMCM